MRPTFEVYPDLLVMKIRIASKKDVAGLDLREVFCLSPKWISLTITRKTVFESSYDFYFICFWLRFGEKKKVFADVKHLSLYLRVPEHPFRSGARKDLIKTRVRNFHSFLFFFWWSFSEYFPQAFHFSFNFWRALKCSKSCLS